ncbi:MAG: HAD-IIIC family phosphatase [Verrucomicrobiaceae bacterium]|nr:MAG: HAD-IIIC family phosphatase [Verrucomicrobiaceae bacterium]
MPEGLASPTLSDGPSSRTGADHLQVGVRLSYTNYIELAASLNLDPARFEAWPEYKIAVVRNITIEPLTPAITGEVMRSGLRPVLHIGNFDSAAAEALDSGSSIYAAKPDMVLVFQWLEAASPAIGSRHVRLGAEERKAALGAALAQVRSIVQGIRANSDAVVLIANAPLPPSPTLGILDSQLEDGHTAAVLEYNLGLARIARETSNAYVLDLMSVVARIGWDSAIDGRMLAMAKAPFSQKALTAIGEQIGRFVRALRAKTRKCLVLDCDNTLWGGIVGEDGVAGVKIGSSFPGSSYREFQERALDLAARGVILAINSKNNRADVIEMLSRHDGMVLRENHFSVIKANWDDKVENLKAIAAELNIGIDSLVFVDDSSFEIDNVRTRLPEVATIRLTGKPAEHAAQLADSGLFDSLVLSSEDRDRTALYAAERKRNDIQSSYDNIEDYLGSLGLVADIALVSPIEQARVFQLMGKTNQFNMTTRRLTEADVARLAEDANSWVVRLRARDSISDLGLVGVAILQKIGSDVEISDLLMSCRALGRGVESAFIARLTEFAFAQGAGKVIGLYCRTGKNALCIGFYEKAGFQLINKDTDSERWERKSHAGSTLAPAWVKIEGDMQ